MKDSKVTNTENNTCPNCGAEHIKYWNIGHYECEVCKALIPEDVVEGIN